MISIIKEWLIKTIIQRKGTAMLKKLGEAFEGKKTYSLAVLGVIISLVGVLWGPVNLAGIEIPKLDWNQFWQTVWASGLFSFLHMKK